MYTQNLYSVVNQCYVNEKYVLLFMSLGIYQDIDINVCLCVCAYTERKRKNLKKIDQNAKEFV